MDWTKEIKEKLVADYLAAKPTVKTSSEIVKNLVEDIPGATINGARIILAKATDAEGNKVYISANAKVTADNNKTASKRVNKQDSMDALVALLEKNSLAVDTDIIGRLTGKASMYFTEVVTAALDE